MSNVHQGIASLRPYLPGKPVDELTRELGITDIIKLASNENPRGPGELVRAAIGGELESLSRYPDGNGFALKQALVSHLGVDVAQITLGNGSNDVLDLIARVAVEPGYEAVVAEHSFVVYRLAVTSAGGTLITVPALNYGTDLEGFAAVITERTRVVFIANPNNPTGTWVTHDDLVTFLEGVPEQVWVVLDEAYFEYVDEPDYPRTLGLLARYPNLIVTRTFSKIYGLAGLRVGYAISSIEISDLLNRLRQPFNANTLALAAAIASLEDDNFVEDSKHNNQAGLQQLSKYFQSKGVEYIPSVANFLTVRFGKQCDQIYQNLLQQGIILRPLANYNLPEFLRVTIGTPQQQAVLMEKLDKLL